MHVALRPHVYDILLSAAATSGGQSLRRRRHRLRSVSNL